MARRSGAGDGSIKERLLAYALPEYALTRPRTRIICTLGPATRSPETLDGLIRAGMSVARLNLSHGSRGEHAAAVAAVREAAARCGMPIGILGDLPGPKHRLGTVAPGTPPLEEGRRFSLAEGEGASTASAGFMGPAGLVGIAAAGDRVLIADGAIELRVERVVDGALDCVVVVGGPLETRKAVTIPGRTSPIDYMTAETVAALDFAAEERLDFVGVSYARSVGDVCTVRDYLAERGRRPRLIAKIEVVEGLAKLDELVEAADGVMVARGDLGVEVPVARVPGIQKEIIRLANAAGIVVITATQMLESMIRSPVPTRAEVADIATAVLDGTDAIMLSGETSIGGHPVAATSVMAEVAIEAEKALDREAVAARRRARAEAVDDAIADAACQAASRVGAKVILAFTESGSSAARVASFRPHAPILAMTRDPAAARALALRWGVTTVHAPRAPGVSAMFREGSRAAIESGLGREGDRAVVVMGVPVGIRGNTNLLRVITLPEPDE